MSQIFNTDINLFKNAKDKGDDNFFKRMPEDKYEYKEEYIVIDSRDRDRTKYPNPNEYVVKFNDGSDGNVTENFRNIVKISLIDAVLPVATTDALPYLTLDIPELCASYAGSNAHLSDTFALLLPEKKGTPYARCKFVAPAINTYRLPLASLNRMTLKFKDYDGTPYDFGTDTSPPTDPDVLIQNQLIFKIVTRSLDYKPLEPILT